MGIGWLCPGLTQVSGPRGHFFWSLASCVQSSQVDMLMQNHKPPILELKVYAAPSVFTVDNLFREARRQKSVAEGVYLPSASSTRTVI